MVKSTQIKKWINFARWSNQSNCIGKGKILDCEIEYSPDGHHTLMIDMLLDGVRFAGLIHVIGSEEE